MTTTIITTDGDVLDEICWHHYGRHAGTVEAVLDANRELSNLDPILPEGLAIELPDLPTTRTASSFRLFD